MNTYPYQPGDPDHIVTNVWDWDPEWAVVWYEGDIRKGAMQQRTGLDPRSVKLHRARRSRRPS